MESVENSRKLLITCNGKLEGRSLIIIRIIFILLLFNDPSFASTITWLPNLEWNTATNWENNVIPKNGSRVIFPVEMRLSVGLPVQHAFLELAGLELPREGAVALPQSGYLTISEVTSSTKSARWTREGPLLWVEPNNWDSERSNAAVPHLERIPCQDDTVVLPESKRMVSIKLPDTFGAKVEAVRVTGDTGNLPSWEWRTVSSQREFYARPTSVGYTGLQSCLDCSCQPEQVGRQLLNEVCKTTGTECPDLGCENPLWIDGHCCPYCGGRLVLPNVTSLSLAKRIAKLALDGYGSTLSWYARKKWDSHKEILIAGVKEYSMETTLNAVDALTSALKEQGVKILSIDTTGGEIRVSRWVAVMGPFFGTLLLAMALFIFAVPYFGYSLRTVAAESWNGIKDMVNNRNIDIAIAGPASSQKHFRFAKFENAPEAEVELEVPSSSAKAMVQGSDLVSDDDEDEDDVENLRGQFANPLYQSGRKKDASVAPSFRELKKLQDDIGAEDEIDLSIP